MKTTIQSALALSAILLGAAPGYGVTFTLSTNTTTTQTAPSVAIAGVANGAPRDITVTFNPSNSRFGGLLVQTFFPGTLVNPPPLWLSSRLPCLEAPAPASP